MYLLESFVVDKASGILRDLELPLLYMLAELPSEARRVSGIVLGR